MFFQPLEPNSAGWSIFFQGRRKTQDDRFPNTGKRYYIWKTRRPGYNAREDRVYTLKQPPEDSACPQGPPCNRCWLGENEIIARLIGKGEIAGFQRCLIDLFDRAVTFIKTVSSAQVSDFTAVNRLAFSGFRKLEVGNDARVAINFSPFFRSDALYIGFSSKNEARIMQNHRYSAKTQRKI